jgi:hypothetical protein
MIYSNSRYASSTIAIVDTPQNFVTEDGPAVQCILFDQEVNFTFQFKYYLWKSTDRPDTVAFAFYGDPTLWWHIADGNPQILDWSEVAAGTVVRVPIF